MTVREAYATLGLDPASTTPDEARARFRELIRAHHPDGKPPHEQARANELTRMIVEACTVLRAQANLRTRPGAPRTAPSTTAGARGRRLDDRPDWVDEVWREFARGNAVGVMWPAFGMFLSLDAWMTGWGMGSATRKRVG